MQTFKTVLTTVLFVFALTTASMAITPDGVREKYPLIARGECVETATQESGFCYQFLAEKGYYLVFVQDGKPVWMRYTEPGFDSFVQVWTAKKGVPL